MPDYTQKGLNRAQREIVRGLVRSGSDGGYVRDQIDKMARENESSRTEWDYNKNVSFTRELTEEGYPETAKNLERLINGKK